MCNHAWLPAIVDTCVVRSQDWMPECGVFSVKQKNNFSSSIWQPLWERDLISKMIISALISLARSVCPVVHWHKDTKWKCCKLGIYWLHMLCVLVYSNRLRLRTSPKSKFFCIDEFISTVNTFSNLHQCTSHCGWVGQRPWYPRSLPTGHKTKLAIKKIVSITVMECNCICLYPVKIAIVL